LRYRHWAEVIPSRSYLVIRVRRYPFQFAAAGGSSSALDATRDAARQPEGGQLPGEPSKHHGCTSSLDFMSRRTGRLPFWSHREMGDKDSSMRSCTQHPAFAHATARKLLLSVISRIHSDNADGQYHKVITTESAASKGMGIALAVPD
jgi:hypothetical protein